MKPPSPAQVETARRWLWGAGVGPSAQERAAAVAQAYERVSSRLDPIIGAAGIRALFARSVRLTQAAHPCLEGLTSAAVAAEHPAQRLRACLQSQEPAVVTAAAAALFATFFGLLSTFIGDRLTTQVLEGLPEGA